MLTSVNTDLMRVLADSLRLRIVTLLAHETLCTTHLVEEAGAKQTNLSDHLRSLREAGVVDTEPCGVHLLQAQVPVQRSDFDVHFRAAVKLAGLPENTRFHDLKHFYTSRLGFCGQHDPRTVQALSRHAEFSETWDTYAHPPVAVEGVKVTAFGAMFRTDADAPDQPQAAPLDEAARRRGLPQQRNSTPIRPQRLPSPRHRL